MPANDKPVCVGLDVGSQSIKAVAVDAASKVRIRTSVPVKGSPFDAVLATLAELEPSCPEPVAWGATGGGKQVMEGVWQCLPENDIVATAAAVGRYHPDVLSIVEIGGHQSKWIKLGTDGEMESFTLNDQCAAGSGAFLEQQAGRLKMTIGQFAALAEAAPQGAPIAGRCSVFAKSDMIHLQQKGTPPHEIAFGLCLALARNFQATLLRGKKLVTPALFCGGGALNAGLYRALLEVFSVGPLELARAGHPQHLAALGAALGAMGRAPLSLAEMRACLEQGGRLVPVAEVVTGRRHPGHLAIRPDNGSQEPEIAPSGPVAAYLGVDVGSVSTDFALVSPEGEVLDGIYLPTRGNPIAVLGEGLAIMKTRTGEHLTVLGVGTTGSGRYLAGKLLGADVVKNEITCQLLGARHALPDVDTILEIGGQDSKYVSVSHGRLVDFVMNKICAAGTGSFLEEQGEVLGVSVRGEFAALASQAESPADLGCQCTVFMDTEVVNSRHRGAPVSDVVAGLAHSVARNYLDKVVAGRPVGESVVFQGGVASNGAVVAAFENLLGHPVTVHPHNRISGAIGAAVAAMREMGDGATGFRGLEAVQSAVASTFECKVCSNRCQVARVIVGTEKAYFGDVCERYTARGGQTATSDLPDLFGERQELLESYAGGPAIRGIAGVPRATALMEMLPFWATFLRNLGYRVVLSPPTTMRTLSEGVKRLAAETCLPIKLTYGHVAALLEQNVDFVFLPSVLDQLDNEEIPSHMCPYVEAVGFMVSTFASDRTVVPTLSLTSPDAKLGNELFDKLEAFGVERDEVGEALAAAKSAQEEFENKLQERGKEILGHELGMAFVLLGKPYNCCDPFQNLNVAQHIRKLGVLPIPMDMLPEHHLNLEKLGITMTWRYNRDMLRTMAATSQDHRLFPVIVSSFGCGPDAFSLKHLEDVARDKPYLFLEFDEHRGEAGLITRLEAFIDEVSHYASEDATRPLEAGSSRATRRKSWGPFRERRFVIPRFADHAWAYVGALKFAEYETVFLPPPDEETLACGEEVSSGRECHAYSIFLGDLVKNVRNGTIRKDDIYFFPGTTVPCLLHQWGRGMELALDRLGAGDVQILTANTAGHSDVFGFPALVRLWRGLVASELLVRARCQLRPYASKPPALDRLFDWAWPALAEGLAEDRLDQALKQIGDRLSGVQCETERRRPIVGVAGDIYTRIHPFGNHNLFNHLENAGLEVWPAPFLVDSVDFGIRKAVSDAVDDRDFLGAAGNTFLFLRKELEAWRMRFHLGTRLSRLEEPGYQETVELAQPYVDGKVNEVLVQNVAKMVHFARHGAAGVINAISFHCMLGTISAALTERVRQDFDMLPMTTFIYGAKSGGEEQTRIEAFAHQVRAFHERKRCNVEPAEDKGWLATLLGQQ